MASRNDRGVRRRGVNGGVLARTGYLGYVNGMQAGAGGPGGHAMIGAAVLLIAWTPLIAMLTLIPVAVMRASRGRSTWWLPLLTLGIGGFGVLSSAVLLLLT